MDRILHIGLSYEYGGIESFVINHFRKIDRQRFSFDFINPYSHPLAYTQEIQSLGGRIFFVPDFHKHPIAYLKELTRIVSDYHVVHIHMLSASNLLPLIVAKHLHVKTIIAHSHNTMAEGKLRGFLHLLFYRVIKYKANVLLACSKDAGKWMFGNKVKFSVVKNSIDLKKYAFSLDSRHKMRQLLGLGVNNIVYGNVGRLNVQKNQKFLLEVFAEILKKQKHAFLCIVGQGELKSDLQKTAYSLNIEKSVLFLGKRTDVAEIYSAMDAIIMPSLFEGLPITLVEAQANGLPCYVSHEGVPRETQLLDNMKFISLDESPDSWSRKILNSNLARCSSATEKLRNKGFDIAISVFNLEEIYKS